MNAWLTFMVVMVFVFLLVAEAQIHALSVYEGCHLQPAFALRGFVCEPTVEPLPTTGVFR